MDEPRCVGLDQSARFIRSAAALQDNELLRYTVPLEGELKSFHETSLASHGLGDFTERCSFVQNDPCNLDPKKFGRFDVVVAANVIERLYSPREFLESVHTFVEDGGLLILSSTYDWDKDLTPVENWIGGYKDAGSGENVSTLAGLSEILADSGKFRFVRTQCEIPQVKRTTARSLSYEISEMTVWERL